MFDNQKKITMSFRKVFIRSFYKSGSSRLEACRDDNFLLNSAVRGFTLIELLVVVLIIGILASVALPQYQVAVTKSRLATLKNLTKALADAQELYYSANGAYAQSFDELDIGLPDGKDATKSNASYYYYNWGTCHINSQQVGCYSRAAKIVYLYQFLHGTGRAGQRFCVATTWDLSHPANKVCKAETNSEAEMREQGDEKYIYWQY